MNKEPIFYSYHDGPYLPSLKVLLRGELRMRRAQGVAPDMMKSVQVDKGAIKFVLSGANIMCRGLTSPGGRLPEGLAKGEPVVRVGVRLERRPFSLRGRRTRLLWES